MAVKPLPSDRPEAPWPALLGLSPWVRRAYIHESRGLSGKWTDFDHVFTCIERGTADVFFGETKFRLGPGHAFLIPPLMPHLIMGRGDEVLRQYVVHFDLFSDPGRRHLNKALMARPDFPPTPERERVFEGPVAIARITGGARLELHHDFHELKKEFRGKTPGREMAMAALATRILVTYLRSLRPALEIPTRTLPGWSRIQEAVAFMHSHFTDPDLTLEAIASATPLSLGHLAAVFKKETGQTLHHALTRLRLDHAKTLMETTGMNLTQIADASGFASIHTFCKVFHKEIGVTPGAHRRSLQPET